VTRSLVVLDINTILLRRFNKMAANNVYDSVKDLYYDLEPGKRAELWYKPTERSRKWRKSSLSIIAYTPEVHDPMAQQLKQQESWYMVEWRELVL
jgi:hypothetical protein